MRSVLGMAVLCITSLGSLALAQTASPSPDKSSPERSSDSTPAAGQTPGMGQPGPAIPGSPNLSVATVTMQGGTRASKLVGAAVFNGSNQQVGTVDDLILDHEHKAALGVISVGGILGVGAKLVAIPFESLHVDGAGKVVVPDASKESLGRMPGFTYGQ